MINYIEDYPASDSRGLSFDEIFPNPFKTKRDRKTVSGNLVWYTLHVLRNINF